MKILALETSAKAVSAAVTEDGRVLASGYQDTGLTHSRTLMPIVEHIMKNAEITMAEISAVAVAVGPGSFTGIRIGVSAAKGLAFAASIPAVGVSTLAAMARNAAFADGLVVCAMDARRNQIYNALFEAKNGALTRPKIVVGDGGRLCAEALAAADVACRLAPPHLVMQHAVSVALEAEEAARKGGLVSAQELLPVYLRPPQAERLRKERESSEKSGQ